MSTPQYDMSKKLAEAQVTAANANSAATAGSTAANVPLKKAFLLKTYLKENPNTSLDDLKLLRDRYQKELDTIAPLKKDLEKLQTELKAITDTLNALQKATAAACLHQNHDLLGLIILDTDSTLAKLSHSTHKLNCGQLRQSEKEIVEAQQTISNTNSASDHAVAAIKLAAGESGRHLSKPKVDAFNAYHAAIENNRERVKILQFQSSELQKQINAKNYVWAGVQLNKEIESRSTNKSASLTATK